MNIRWASQLGSLGGGNHFIELCLDERDVVWVVLHSGSRGIGNKLAQRHIKTAQKLTDHLGLPDRDLAYLPELGPAVSRADHQHENRGRRPRDGLSDPLTASAGVPEGPRSLPPTGRSRP